MHNSIKPSDIRRLIAGDEKAFKKVYDLYSEQVFQLALRFLKDTEWSEEIVQEVFLRLWVNHKKLDAAGNMWLYLYVIAKRLSLNRLRQVRNSALHMDQLMINMATASNQTEEAILVADMERYTQKVITSLPKQQQLVFNLSRMEGLSHKEIAERLGISPNTVKNHMVEALKTLKASLNHSYFLAILFYLTAQ